MIGKALTIKTVSKEDLDFINEVKTKNNLSTNPEAFAKIIQMARGKAEQSTISTENFEAENQELIKVNKSLTLQIEELTNKPNNEEDLKELKTKIENLKNEAENLKTNQLTLTGTQFICQLTDDVAYKARKYRKYIYQDGYLNKTENPNFPSDLANLCIKRFIKSVYE